MDLLQWKMCLTMTHEMQTCEKIILTTTNRGTVKPDFFVVQCRFLNYIALFEKY